MLIQYNSISNTISHKLDEMFNVNNFFIEILPGKVIMPKKFIDIAEQVQFCPVRDDDIWLISFPRSGSTWAQEMVWLLGNNLDYEGARKLQPLRSPLLELTAIFYQDHKEWLTNTLGNSVEHVTNLTSPRYIKSHLPWQLLPKQLDTVKPKIIYVARNPKDLCVSFYHYCILLHGLNGTFEDFCEIFLDGNAPVCPMWPHVLDFWNRRNDENVLFIKYEDMKRNLPETIKKCASFLNINHRLSNNEIEILTDYLNFTKMQKNPAVNCETLIEGCDEIDEDMKNSIKFIRKGEIGDWKNYMSKDLSKKFDDWILENSYGTGLEFDYE